jgi:hypothetical protein
LKLILCVKMIEGNLRELKLRVQKNVEGQILGKWFCPRCFEIFILAS